jgi:hypothetical protein
VNLPADLGMPARHSVSFTVEAPAGIRECPSTAELQSSWSWRRFFGVAAMAGGWDDAAWAAKGLPTSGKLTIKLTVSK